MSWLQASVARSLVLFERLTSGCSYDPLSQRHRNDPYPGYHRLRRLDPIHRSRLTGGLVLTRYEDCSELLRDSRFSVDLRNSLKYPRIKRRLLESGGRIERMENPNLLQVDPPTHTRLRGLVSKGFTPRAIAHLEPTIVATAHGLIDRIAAPGTSDMMKEFARPFPILVIAEMLGIPDEERDQFDRWACEIVLALGLLPSSDGLRRAARANDELDLYMTRMIEERRKTPGDDVISVLTAAEDGDRLTHRDLLSFMALLLIAGYETTSSLLGNGLLALLRNPGELALLREEPARIDGAIEELLRFESPVQVTFRIALEDVEIRGRPVRKGETTAAVLGAANRDPEMFADPDRLDVTRDCAHHLAFSQGRHYCLAASLARLEAKVAFRALLERLPVLELSGPKTYAWRAGSVLRGLESLSVRCDERRPYPLMKRNDAMDGENASSGSPLQAPAPEAAATRSTPAQSSAPTPAAELAPPVRSLQELAVSDALATDTWVVPFVGPAFDPATERLVAPLPVGHAVAVTRGWAKQTREDQVEIWKQSSANLAYVSMAPGFLGVSLSGSREVGTSKTLSIWRDEKLLLKFVHSPVHRRAVQITARNTQAWETLHWIETESSDPPTFDDAVRRLDRARKDGPIPSVSRGEETR